MGSLEHALATTDNSPAGKGGGKRARTWASSNWLIRRNADFRRFWAGQSLSSFGDQVTLIALPTIAILALHASVLEVGLLASAGYIAYPVVGIFAGAWVDRLSRRRVLMAADMVRLVAVGAPALAAVLGYLNIELLFAVGLVSGAATCFFSSAYQAYLPSVVPNADIVNGNALMEISNSTAQVSGPSVAGILIGLLGSAFAMLVDAASYGVSVLTLALIRGAEQRPEKRRHNLLPDVREGLVIVWRHPLLRRLALTAALANVGRGLALELFLLFAYRALHLTPLVVGFMLAAGSLSTLLGSAVCRSFARRLGLGRAMLIAGIGKGLPWLLTPVALVAAPIPVMVGIIAASGFFIPVWNVNSVSLRQYMTDPDVLGRVSATVRTVTSSAVPLSGVLGGVLATIGVVLWGDRIGLAAVLALGGAIWAAATLVLPIPGMRRLRDADDAVSTYGRVTALVAQEA